MKLSVKRTPESPVSEGAVVALDAVYGKIAKRQDSLMLLTNLSA